MLKLSSVFFAFVAAILFSAEMGQAAVPANDMFANATTLTGRYGQIWASNEGATKEAGEPEHVTGVNSTASVWWNWTPDGYGKAEIFTLSSSFDTVLAVYEGTAITGLTKVASNDDFNGQQSYVTFDAFPGKNYKIAVAGWGGLKGAIFLTWKFTSDNFIIHDVDFAPAAPTAVQPGAALTLARWSFTGVVPDKPVWLEFFASNNGGFTLSRFGGTITNSCPLHESTIFNGNNYFTPHQTLNWIPDGIYTVVGFINRPGSGGPSELHYSDNWAPLAGKRLRVHNSQPANCNLVLKNATFTRDGTNITVTGIVQNTGASATPDYGFWVETAYGTLSAEGNFTEMGFIGGGKKVGRLSAGGLYNYSQTGTAPLMTSLAIMADSTDIVPETEERDNWAYDGFLPAPCGTDLDVGFVSASIASDQLAPVELRPTDKLRLSCSVINRTSIDSGVMWLEFFASQTGGLSTIRSGVPLVSSSMIVVPANHTANYDLNLNFEGIPDGIYSVVAIVNRCGVPSNPGDSNPYQAGGDNLYRIPGRIILRNDASPGANLLWSTQSVSVNASKVVTITGNVKNVGSHSTTAFWTEAFYGLVDPQTGAFTPHGQISGGVRTNILGPTNSAPIEISGPIPSGTWTVGVITDSTDLVSETDETDNWFLHVL